MTKELKQHITVDQLNELNEETYKKLVVKEYGVGGANVCAKRENCKRMFSIGKMIDMLNNEFGWFEIEKESNEADGTVFWISIDPTREYYDYELCDALWKAVKEVL